MFVGCALGALLATQLRFPKVGAAILFPPYAVLTAFLLVEQPRRYWLLLLASAAGDFVPHLQTGPAPFVLLTELANFSRALLVAFAVRRYGCSGANLSLRGLGVFLVASVAAGPALGATIGAAVVSAFRETSFWLVFRAWFFSNALTGITLLPTLWLLVSRPRFTLPSPGRLLEAGALGCGLVGVGVLVFLGSSSNGGALTVSIYLPMPFLLWTAVRFGPGAVSGALLCVAFLTILGAIEARGPFATGSPTEDLLDLQLFLLVVSIPLMLLSALVEEQRRTAAELSASRAQYLSVVEAQSEMICRFLPDGTYTFVNGAFRRHHGLTEGDLGSSSAFELVPRASLGDLSPERAVVVRETEGLDEDGRPSWHQWQDRGIYGPEGQLVEYQSVGRDITPDKIGERRERELMAQREVERALREMDRHKDEFLAMLGHELRNPLAPIGSALDLLGASPVGQKTVRAREVIARQLAHLKRLVDDLLDVSRITRGDIRVELRALDASEVIEQAVETVRPLIESRGHELRVVVPETAAPIRADKERLAQVLVNLLNNAARYTERGGRITLSLQIESGSALFCVEDNGIGISETLIERVFGLFERGTEAPEHSSEGLGIGLTLARRLVELHDGEIVASSGGRGKGSMFMVRVPLASAADPVSAIQPLSRRTVEAAPLRILVVDDNIDAADTLAEVLIIWGHHVRSVYTGAAALSAARQQLPDVVLSDLGLPDLSGLDLVRQLRPDLPADRHLLIAITGFGQARDRTRSVEAGFDHHLVKPIDFTELARLLASARRRPAAVSSLPERQQEL